MFATVLIPCSRIEVQDTMALPGRCITNINMHGLNKKR
jgi:hypothetical protein